MTFRVPRYGRHGRKPALIEVRGMVMTIAEWCESMNIKRRTVEYRRLQGRTWEQALTDPVRGRNQWATKRN